MAAELPTAERHVISEGHVDAVGVHHEDGALALRIHDATVNPPVERDPGETLLHLKPEAAVPIPDGLAPIYYEVLGPVGSVIWLLPEAQDPLLLWPGWSSETIPYGVFAGDQLTWRLLSVAGPGRLLVFQEGAGGLEPSGIRFDTRDGLPDETTMNAGAHAHFDWVFSAPGLYRLRFEVEGTLAGGAHLTSGPVEYRYFVGDLADLPPDPPVGDPPPVDPPPSEPAPVPQPPDTQPAPVPSPDRRAEPARLAATVGTVVLRDGRRLVLRLRLSRAAQVRVAVRRGERRVAAARPRRVDGGARTVRLRLGRALAPGRYRVIVRVRARGSVVTRVAALHVRAPR